MQVGDLSQKLCHLNMEEAIQISAQGSRGLDVLKNKAGCIGSGPLRISGLGKNS